MRILCGQFLGLSRCVLYGKALRSVQLDYPHEGPSCEWGYRANKLWSAVVSLPSESPRQCLFGGAHVNGYAALAAWRVAK